MRSHFKANQSIRRYLLSSIFAVIVVGWSISAGLNFIDAKEQVAELFDAELAQMSRVLQSLMLANQHVKKSVDQQGPLPYFDQEVLAERFEEEEFSDTGHEYERKIAFEVWNAGGQLVLANHLPLPQDFKNLSSGYSTISADNIDWRSFTLIDQVNGFTIRVAQRADVRDELTGEIAMHNVIPGLFITPLILLICGMAIRRGLHPLASISSQLKNRDYANLTPLSTANTPLELQQVTSEINELFSRVSESYQREKRFTSDAAHELRTPLSIAKVHLQNVQQVSQDETVQAYVDKALKGIERLIHLVRQLLTLSRLESAKTRLDESICMNSLLADIQAELSVLPENENVSVNQQSNALVVLKGSDTEMRILLRNILDNAFRYAEKNSGLDITLNAHELRVFNQCAQDSSVTENMEGMFERFKRGTKNYSEGSGLGLAICRQICDHYSYTISLRIVNKNNHQGMEVLLRFHPP